MPTQTAAMTQSTVEIAPTWSMRRQSEKSTIATSASEMAWVATHDSEPVRYSRYWTMPMMPVDMISGIVNIAVHTNRNGMRRPLRYWNASRRYRYVPPAPGIAAPSSAHTSPSTSASTAPTIQPNTACGPPSAAIISGMVTNGPIPHICVMLTATAWRRPNLRSKPPSTSSTIMPPFPGAYLPAFEQRDAVRTERGLAFGLRAVEQRAPAPGGRRPRHAAAVAADRGRRHDLPAADERARLRSGVERLVGPGEGVGTASAQPPRAPDQPQLARLVGRLGGGAGRVGQAGGGHPLGRPGGVPGAPGGGGAAPPPGN